MRVIKPRSMRLTSVLSLGVLLFGPALALAERVDWKFEAYQKFDDAMFTRESGPMIYTEDRAPKYVLTRFVVEGESAEDWTEALEIINTSRKNEPKNVQAWYERFKAHGDETCKSEWQVLKESKKALMFERHSDACEPFEAQHALYNLLYGKREVFLMIATRKGAMDADTRDGWMQLLQTAKVHR